jgi:hypothetical protein
MNTPPCSWANMVDFARVQPVERVYRVWVVPVRGVGGMDAVVKPTWRYLRRPLTGTAQTHRSDKRTTGYTPLTRLGQDLDFHRP